jgi:hypothetical protein
MVLKQSSSETDAGAGKYPSSCHSVVPTVAATPRPESIPSAGKALSLSPQGCDEQDCVQSTCYKEWALIKIHKRQVSMLQVWLALLPTLLFWVTPPLKTYVL